MKKDKTAYWDNFHIGPKLRAQLGLSTDHKGQHKQILTEEHNAEFLKFCREQLRKEPIETLEQGLELLEEFVYMHLGSLALWFHETFQKWGFETSFQGAFLLGTAAMLEKQYATAQMFFEKALIYNDQEPATYYNLAQLHWAQYRDDLCLENCLKTIHLDPNHRGAWELIAQVYQQRFGDRAADEIRILAQTSQSWVGQTVAAILKNPNDPLVRSQALEKIYKKGEPSQPFLVEYTAALGLSLDYEKIIDVINQAECQATLTGKPLCWQLYAHAAQAYLGLEQREKARQYLKKALQHPDIIDSARAEILNLLEDTNKDLTAH